MYSPTLLFVLLCSLLSISSSPTRTRRNGPVVIPITKRDLVNPQTNPNPLSPIDTLQNEVAYLNSKYAAIATIDSDADAGTESLHVRAQTGNEALGTNYPFAWFGPVSVGTPAQTMSMDFDTVRSCVFPADSS
jgi:hypothetical protein